VRGAWARALESLEATLARGTKAANETLDTYKDFDDAVSSWNFGKFPTVEKQEKPPAEVSAKVSIVEQVCFQLPNLRTQITAISKDKLAWATEPQRAKIADLPKACDSAEGVINKAALTVVSVLVSSACVNYKGDAKTSKVSKLMTWAEKSLRITEVKLLPRLRSEMKVVPAATDGGAKATGADAALSATASSNPRTPEVGACVPAVGRSSIKKLKPLRR